MAEEKKADHFENLLQGKRVKKDCGIVDIPLLY